MTADFKDRHSKSARGGIGFFRLFGYGLHWKDTRRHRLLWSERNRVFIQWHVGPWVLTPLKRGARGFRCGRGFRSLRSHELAWGLVVGVVGLAFVGFLPAALVMAGFCAAVSRWVP